MFKECDTCASQPGIPVLCKGCLHNRRIITLAVWTLTGMTSDGWLPKEYSTKAKQTLIEMKRD